MRTRSPSLAGLATALLIAISIVSVSAVETAGTGTGTSWQPSVDGGDGAPLLSQDQATYDPVLATMLSQISEAEIYQTAYDLQNCTTRYYPSTGNEQAAIYLYNRLSTIPGLEVAYPNTGHHNVIATLPGMNRTSDDIIVVGAHYDSISYDLAHAPGGTDDGGGVGIVLELARVMSKYHFDHTIQFAFWNGEEVGLLGSYEYVADAMNRSVTIPLYFNYDVSCYDPDNRYVLDVLYESNTAQYADLLTRYNSLYDINFTLTYNVYDGGSDHHAFWCWSIPAIMTHSQLDTPEAHTPYDTVDLISTSFARKNGQLGMALLATTAGLSSMAVVPGGSAVPGDLNGDGKYDDVNGDGRRDFADVTLYINQMSWIAANEPLASFDFNDNGRIDFRDIVWLFNTV